MIVKAERVILGVDPGLIAAGFSIIGVHDGRIILKECGALRQRSEKSLSERICIFNDFFSDKIVRYQVTELALETPFLGKNAQNFLKLGYLRGILLLLVGKHVLTLHEFAPRQVKAALTGYGSADKEQLLRVITRLFPGFIKPDSLDVSDAVAIGLCAAWRHLA